MTLAQARTYVLSRLGISSADSDVTDQIDLDLDAEYQLLVLENELLVDQADLIFTLDDPIVDLPDDFAVMLRLNIGDLTLSETTWDEYASLSTGPATDSGPTHFLMSGINRIRIWPTPTENDAAGASLWYATTAAPWNDESEEPTALPSAFHRLPADRVVAAMALLEEDIGLAQVHQARANEMEGRLRRHLAKRGGPGHPTIRVRGLPHYAGRRHRRDIYP